MYIKEKMCPRIVADIVHEMSPSKKAIFFVHEMSYDLSTKCHVICPRIVGKNVHEMSSNQSKTEADRGSSWVLFQIGTYNAQSKKSRRQSFCIQVNQSASQPNKSFKENKERGLGRLGTRTWPTRNAGFWLHSARVPSSLP